MTSCGPTALHIFKFERVAKFALLDTSFLQVTSSPKPFWRFLGVLPYWHLQHTASKASGKRFSGTSCFGKGFVNGSLAMGAGATVSNMASSKHSQLDDPRAWKPVIRLSNSSNR